MPKRAKTTNKYERKTRRTTTKRTKAETAFPAPEQTPGQSQSRAAFDVFEKQHDKAGWWSDYAHLRNEGYTWRIAAYIAWAASPLQRRWPATIKELATEVLGLRSDKVIYKWRKMNSKIDERVISFRSEALLRFRQDVIQALVDVAAASIPEGHQDRKLFFEMTGDYKPRQAVEMSGAGGGPVQSLNLGDLSKMGDAELDQFIANIEAITRNASGSAPGAGTPSAPGNADHAVPVDVDGNQSENADSKPTA